MAGSCSSSPQPCREAGHTFCPTLEDKDQCKHPPKPDGTPNSADGFHLEKKLTSKSYLQESWIFLLRLLF